MFYFDSAEGEIITAKRAEQEIINHGCDFSEFLADNGEYAEYDAQAVLAWLGY